MNKFEKGKRYKFDAESFIKYYDEKTYEDSRNLWIEMIEDVVFEIDKEYAENEAYKYTEEECEYSFEVNPAWCVEVK